MPQQFCKYQGLGNDFILIDNRATCTPLVTPAQAVQWCDRHFGVGADGVILALPGEGEADYTMRIFNADGSEPEMCGNGIRCLAQFLASHGAQRTCQIATGAGLIRTEVRTDHQVTVDMGKPRLRAQDIPTTLGAPDQPVIDLPLSAAGQTWSVTSVSMGNPHCVVFVPDLAAVCLGELGPQFEHHPAFPQRTNTEFVQVLAPDLLAVKVWERGAGATLACGTGACAVLVAAVLNHHSPRAAVVRLPGGDLAISWSTEDEHLFMTGPALEVFRGEI